MLLSYLQMNERFSRCCWWQIWLPPGGQSALWQVKLWMSFSHSSATHCTHSKCQRTIRGEKEGSVVLQVKLKSVSNLLGWVTKLSHDRRLSGATACYVQSVAERAEGDYSLCLNRSWCSSCEGATALFREEESSSIFMIAPPTPQPPIQGNLQEHLPVISEMKVKTLMIFNGFGCHEQESSLFCRQQQRWWDCMENVTIILCLRASDSHGAGHKVYVA